ncbi:unnamed protein product [Caenorhabditis angaria]|uniref:Uncharacterized protein n=1 Tax=Caenorhabditis angaria TaxID=860376 RepID=A0A9P1IBD3_9PELO|nr:unnamed protein product [Caenorhabditis angaria]
MEECDFCLKPTTSNKKFTYSKEFYAIFAAGITAGKLYTPDIKRLCNLNRIKILMISSNALKKPKTLNFSPKCSDPELKIELDG